ncbi:FadR/GntR family transcriptional regulator [Nocardia carnea]|uniref:FadR/GntR family transcriptional regulator n=1 Tax=Nocardia carnea TaxID=37328 RepID=UPI00245465BE|nr:GntR family transcriptional regulator [Nocardia carnea]
MRAQEGREPAAAAPEKLAVHVARRLEREIIEREWPIGEVLGSETTLRERLGVSRPILREAVRLLEHSRVAQMRQGPGGGLIVRAPDPRPALRGIVIALEYRGATVEQLLRARGIFERMAIARVTDSLSEDGVRELRLCAAGMGRGRAGDFHLALGRLSGNPVLELFIDILMRLTAAYTHRALGNSAADPADDRAAAVRHREIADAIIAGDTGRALCRTMDHLQDTAAWLGRFVDPVPGERTATRPMDPDPDERPRERKSAEALAGRIHDDIVAEGRHVGEVLGSENDFMTRYGVSRSVFREAVRILEHYSVARMRRGPGGGLVFLEPDPMSSIRTVGLYLGYRRVTADDLRAVREGIELGCLSAAMRAGAVPGALRPQPGNPAAKACSCSTCFRDRVESASGDLVLGMLRSILAVLWDEHGSARGPHDPCDSAGPGSTERKELERIAEAMTDGDSPLALFRMRRHLRAHPGW